MNMMATEALNNTVPNQQQWGLLCDERSRRPRVLIVDDDRDLCVLIAQLLRDEGFEIDIANDGQDGLDKAHDNPPHIIVLDMMMPVMDGWAFRAHQRYCVTLGTIPVVILSGLPPAHLRNVGAVAALQKPFDYDELVAVVRAHC
jgi:DNA-binding response OmpR family regulator